MKTHEEFAAVLPVIVSGRLTDSERDEIAAHLEICEACRSDLALWKITAGEIRAASEAIVPPAGLAARALTAATTDRSLSGVARRVWRLILAQIPIVRRELFPASAVLMIIGLSLAILLHRTAVFYFVAPMIAAAGLAMIYGREHDPALELTLATQTSPWKILLARLTLVSAYNLALAFAASAALCMVMPAGLFETVVLGWLGPLTFLSALGLALSMWIGAGPALLISYSAWLLYWIPIRIFTDSTATRTAHLLEAYRGFWNSPIAMLGAAAVLIFAALWSAERTVRPGFHVEAVR